MPKNNAARKLNWLEDIEKQHDPLLALLGHTMNSLAWGQKKTALLWAKRLVKWLEQECRAQNGSLKNID